MPDLHHQQQGAGGGKAAFPDLEFGFVSNLLQNSAYLRASPVLKADMSGTTETSVETSTDGTTDLGGAQTRLRKKKRHEQILMELRLASHVRVSDLAARFGVTTETVRRDIEDLNRAGLLEKSYGGASARSPGAHRGLDERRRERIGERESLARRAVAMVRDGQSLMVDAGATTMEFARALALAGTQVTVITNSLQVAMILGTSRSARVVLTPGDYLNAEAALVGPDTCEYLHRFNVDRCFVGASGLSDVGVTEAVQGFAEVKRAMMERSLAPTFLIDSSKFGQVYLSQVATVSEIGTLVTDAIPTDRLMKTLESQGVEIVRP